MTFTISDSEPRRQYVGTGAQTAFSVPFEFRSDTDLVVRVDGALKVLNTDYTLIGAGVSGGGTCTFTVAPANNAIVTLYRDMPIARTSDQFAAYGLLPGEVLEAALDDVTMKMQQVERDVGRSIHMLPYDTGLSASFELPLPAVRANKFMRFDASGNLELAVSVGSTVISQAIVAALLWPIVAVESGAGVVSVNPYNYGEVQRYTGIAQAIAVCKGLNFRLKLDGTTRAIGSTLNVNGSLTMEGVGTDYPAASHGSVLTNVLVDQVAIAVDGTGTRVDRCDFSRFRLNHTAATKYGITVFEATYFTGECVVIDCQGTGFAGLFLGETTAIPTSDTYLPYLEHWDIRNYTSRGVRINSKGHTFNLKNFKVGSSVAAAVAGEFNTEAVRIDSGQWTNLLWNNIGAGDIEGGSACHLKFEGVTAGKYGIECNGTTRAFIGLEFDDVGANLAAIEGTVVGFIRAKWGKLLNPAIRNPQGNAAGSHTGAANAATLTDGTQAFTVNEHVNRVIHNLTDGSRGTITANTATTVTATLAGGTENDWDVGDKFIIGGALCEWGANSESCTARMDYNAATAPIIVNSAALRATKIVTGRIARSQVANITVHPNLTTILEGGIDDLPADFQPVHVNGQWNYNFHNFGDDEAFSLTPPYTMGRVEVYNDDEVSTWGEVAYDVRNPAAVALLDSGFDFEATTGALTGTTGANNKATVSPNNDGTLHFEMRKGVSNVVILIHGDPFSTP